MRRFPAWFRIACCVCFGSFFIAVSPLAVGTEKSDSSAKSSASSSQPKVSSRKSRKSSGTKQDIAAKAEQKQSIDHKTVPPAAPDLQQLFQNLPPGISNAGGQNASATSFSGVVNINGQEFRTTDPTEFARLQKQMTAGFPAFPSVNVSNAASAAFQGAININGQAFQTNDPAEFRRIQQQFGNLLQGRPRLNAGNANTASSFSGMINQNGHVQTFTDPEAFKQAQQQLKLLP